MGDWRTLLSVQRFRALWIALLCANLGSWSVLAALPILVADRFGAGGALVMSLSWRLLPKILLAPVSGLMLRRFGAPRVASLALTTVGVLTFSLPWCRDFVLLQVAIACIGAADAFMLPGLMSMRGAVTPQGMELAGNSLCSMADRIGKTVGPLIGGVAVLAGFEAAFFLFAAALILAALPVSRLPRPARSPGAIGNSILGMAVEFWRMIRGDRVLFGLLVCAVTYCVMLGGLRPFLFWANRDWYGAADTAWTGLMAAQGAGAVLGAITAGTFNRALLRRGSAYGLSLVTGVLEGAFHLLLLLTSSPWVAMVILAVAGIPEVISTAAWFTAMQQRLTPDRQGVFFAFTAPLWDCAWAIGVMSAGFHASGLLGLSPWWAMISLTATLPLLPLIGWNAWRNRDQALAR